MVGIKELAILGGVAFGASFAGSFAGTAVNGIINQMRIERTMKEMAESTQQALAGVPLTLFTGNDERNDKNHDKKAK